jgi:hypothetical protein
MLQAKLPVSWLAYSPSLKMEAIKATPKQAVKAHKAVRRQGSHIF